jgi:D-tyrosyl-tRNA(Tyr) deacylase
VETANKRHSFGLAPTSPFYPKTSANRNPETRKYHDISQTFAFGFFAFDFPMRVILQRVTHGSVTVDGRITGSVDRGFVALVGVTHGDTEVEAELLAKKTANLRVFEDDQGKMNLSALDTGAGLLVVSQFTLYADARKGRRPSFINAAPPETAAPLVDYYAERLRAEGIQRVEMGIFGAMMQVEIHNDGPVTIMLDSSELA